MTRHMTSRTKASIFTFFAFVTLALAGCGSHDQAGGSGTMNSAQIQENAKKQNQPTNSPASGAAPAASTTH